MISKEQRTGGEGGSKEQKTFCEKTRPGRAKGADLDNAPTAGVEATLEQAPEPRYDLRLVPDVWMTSSNFVFPKQCANIKG